MFRFTIRELVLLTVILAMGMAWWLTARHWIVANQLLTEENRALQLEVKLANEKSDKAWAAAHDPFYRPNPLDDVYRSRRR